MAIQKKILKGTAYGIGVGPGDPELMTLKAIRLIRENEIIAFPGREAKDSTAYEIALLAVPELADKVLVPVHMPMSKDRKLLGEAHRRGALLLEQYLDQGKNVVYLALGDPTVYCSFSYLQHILEADGYPVVLVSGVSSFCVAAARLNMPLTEGDEPMHVFPAARGIGQNQDPEGTCVYMKSGNLMKEIKDILKKNGREAAAVLHCGMEGEQLCRNIDEIPDDAGYFSLVISKQS